MLYFAGNDESDDQESQTSLHESLNRGDSQGVSMDPSGDRSEAASKTIDIEKLKQLQNLYKLNLIQQQMEQSSSECKGTLDPTSGSVAESNLFSSLETSFRKLPTDSKATANPKPLAALSTPSTVCQSVLSFTS